MTIDAGDRGGVARLTVKLAVAVHIGEEMAVGALHSFGEMNILQMDGLGKLVRIFVRDFVVLQIEQIAFAIVFEDSAKDPAVPVVVGELRVLQLRIQFRDAIEKLRVAPQGRAPPPLRDCFA